jgi:hypothetical protein
MRNRVVKVVRLSALVAAGGALSFVVFFSNCGGSPGMRTGNAGATGTGGSGTAGTMGSAGATGTAGVTGTGGAAGRFTCPTDSVLNCGAGVTLASGHVTNFSPEEWTPMDGKWCDASGLRGTVFSYSGPTVDGGDISSHDHAVDATAGNFRLSLMAGSTGYAGGGLQFDHCVNATGSNALRFTATLASGDLTGCNFKVQLVTFEQRPLTPLPAGGCDPAAGSCYGFPTSPALAVTSTATPFTVPFTSFTTNAAHAAPVPGQIVGLQWQLESGAPLTDGGAQPACTVEIRIDDVDFVTQ